jgi:cytochrome c oxidase subunit IV
MAKQNNDFRENPEDYLDHHDAFHHITPVKTYYIVFAVLMVLTIITVAVAMFDLGFLNTPVALIIAIIKATIVILYFMHVRHSSKLTAIIVISYFVWLGVLFLFTFTDYMTRHLSEL